MHPFRLRVYNRGMGEPCSHTRRQLIAKDEVLQFLECLDCGEILESDEAPEQPAVDESLSDA